MQLPATAVRRDAEPLAGNTGAIDPERPAPQPGHRGAIGKVGPSGALTRFAWKLDRPRGVALDSGGNLYVADGREHHGRVLRFRAPPSPAVAAPAFTNQSPLGLTGTVEVRSRIDAFVNDTSLPTTVVTQTGLFALAIPLRLLELLQLATVLKVDLELGDSGLRHRAAPPS